MPGSRCSVGGCSNKRDGNISLHKFPADPILLEKWIRVIKNTGTSVSRAQWTGPPSSSSRNSQLVCSEHFKLEDFTLTTRLHWQSNLQYKATLNPSAVPSLFGEQITVYRSNEPVMRGAFRKRECERIIRQYDATGGEELGKTKTEASVELIAEAVLETESQQITEDDVPVTEVCMPINQEEIPSTSAVELPYQSVLCAQVCTESEKTSPSELSEENIEDIQYNGKQKPDMRNKIVQVHVKTAADNGIKVSTRTKRTQTLSRHHIRMVSSCSQYNICDIQEDKQAPAITPASHSTPKKIKVPRLLPDLHDETFSSLSTFLDPHDETFRLDESVDTPDASVTSDPNIGKDPKEQRKYLVFEDNLLELFETCPNCGLLTDNNIHQTVGTYISVRQECSCGYRRLWESQPKVQNIPAGNILLSASILFSGCCPTKVLRMFEFLKMITISMTTFWSHQKDFLWPAIDRVWTQYQNTMFEALRARGGQLILAGDGRADSPGHCAKYGTYSVLDVYSGKVIDIQLVQSNEVKGSCHMELEGLKRCVQTLKRESVSILEIITDRHLQIQKWIRENLTDTRHSFDVWHIAKGLKKKLVALAKEKDCGHLSSWIKSISNHLYWCASSTKAQDGDLILSKWKSIVNHVQDIHKGHEGRFSECQHGLLDDREWLKPGTKLCVKLEDILLSKHLLKDIPKMSTGFQTSGLEAYHSVINQYAPKMMGYSYQGQRHREILSALHYNENVLREEAQTEDGEVQVKISFPKFKSGDDYSVKTKKEKMTFQYVAALMESTMNIVNISEKVELAAATPPPLTADKRKPSHDEAREKLSIRRFKKMKKIID